MHAKSVFAISFALPNIAYSWMDLVWGSAQSAEAPEGLSISTDEN